MECFTKPWLHACATLTLAASLTLAGFSDTLPAQGRPLPSATNKAEIYAIPFESLARNTPEGTLPRKPCVFLALSAAAAAPFLKHLSHSDRLAVKRLDFSSRVVVAVFSGAKGSSGHGVRVEKLAREGSVLRITARISTPGPNGYALTVFTSPYHVLAVPRAALAKPLPTSWTLMDTAHQKKAGGRF